MAEDKHLKEQENFFKDIFNDANDYKAQLEEESLADSLQNLAPSNDKRYEELSLIGEGALKKVYLCRDHLVGRDVALARMKAGAHIDDFLNEARLAATLSHPYIAAIHDIGFDDEDQAFFVMELYEGENLQDYLDRHEKLSLNEAIEIFLKVCEALAFAHSCGILHLDIKPSNVRIDEFGGILLCDWGISRTLNTQSPEFKGKAVDHLQKISQGTLMGELRGTPDFMAPEQHEKRAKIKQSTDVYGLGSLLLCLLQSAAIDGRDKKQLLEELNRPQAIKAICRKCLEQKPEERYQSVEELINDLEKFKNNILFSVDGLSSFELFSYFIKRYKRQLVLLTINIAIFIALVSYYRSWQKEQDLKLRETQQQLIDQEKSEKEQMILEAQEAYIQARLLFRSTGDQAFFNMKNFNIAETLIKKAIKLNPKQADYYFLLASLQFTKKNFAEAQANFAKSPEEMSHFTELNSKVKAIADTQGLSRSEKFIQSLSVLQSYPKTQFLKEVFIKHEILQTRDKNTKVRLAAIAICLISNEPADSFTYNIQKGSLRFDAPKVQRLFPLHALQVNELIIAKTKVGTPNLWVLNLSSISKLDLSYSRVKSLSPLIPTLVEELNISGCKLHNINHLRYIRHLKVLNIAYCDVDLSPLKHLKLEKIIISKDQEETVKKLIRKNTNIIVSKK